MEYLPTSEKDRARIHQFGKKVIPGIFFRTCFDRGVIWKGDILIADIEKLEKLDASEIYTRRLNAKGVLITQSDGEFVSIVADGSAKLSGRDYEFQEPTLRRESNVEAIGKSFNLKNPRMTQKSGMTSSLFREISFIVIILNREIKYMCLGKSHSLFH